MPIPLPDLPRPDVVERLDYEAIRAAMLAELLARWPEWTALLESDPAVKIVEAAAYVELLLRDRINAAARATMLAYAAGADLDHAAAATDVARLPGESDERLRARAQAAWAALSTAGPLAAYRHWAGAVEGVGDVLVTTPAAGQVLVTVSALAADGAAGADLLAAVRAAVTSDLRRPITDDVTVQAASVQTYTVAAVLAVGAGGPDAEAVRAASEAAVRIAVADRRIGRDVPASRLYGALFTPGVDDVGLTIRIPAGTNITRPVSDVAVGATTVPVCTAVEVTLAA